MWVLPRAWARLRAMIGLCDILLLGWFFLYVQYSVQPHLVYYAHTPIFSLAPEFLPSFPASSGGLTSYASLFLAQLDAWGWPGALVRTGEAFLIVVLAAACFRRLAGRPAGFIRFLPAVLYMLMCGRYNQPHGIGPMLIATLVAVLAFAAAPLRVAAPRFALYSLVTLLVYYVAAGAEGKLALVLTMAAFGILSTLLEVRRGGTPGALAASPNTPLPTEGPSVAAGGDGLRGAAEVPAEETGPAAPWRSGPPKPRGGGGWIAAYLLLPALVAVVGERYLLTSGSAAWESWLAVPATPAHVLAVWLLLSMPLAALAWGPGERLAGRWRARRAGRAGGEPAGQSVPAPRRPVAWSLLGALAFVWGVSLVAAHVTGDRSGRSQALMEYLVMSRQWEQVLATAATLRPEEQHILTGHDIDRALYYTGRLSEEMFQYGQRVDAMLLPMAKAPVFAYRWRLADQYLDLGRVNSAEMALYEALPLAREHPFLLRRLAIVHMVKGQLPVARLYLHRLQYDVVHRGWARHTLRLLDEDPQLLGDQEIQRLRAVMLTHDDLLEISDIGTGSDGTQYYPDRILANLVRQSPQNRMAFEYLMALYLLLGRPDLMAQELHRLGGFGDERIPRAWEEGLVLYMGETGVKPDLRGRTIRPETLERYARFQEILARYGSDLKGAYPEVARECAGTYFAYMLRRRVTQ